MSSQLERNKQNVTGFYDLMFNQCKPAEAVRQYVGNGSTQYNTAVADYEVRRELLRAGKRKSLRRADSRR